jgi:hypothetical protein
MSYFKDIEFLQEQQQKKSKIINQPIKQEEPKKGALQSFKDEFVLQNTITSTLNNTLSNNIEDQEEDINYDIGGKLIGTKYEPYADSFIGKVYNDAQFNNIATKIDRELELRENNDPVWGTVGAIAGGVLDPINLIPIGGTAYKTFKTGKTLKGAIRGAEIGAVTEAATETILQSQQETRTMEESVINVAGGVVLGGLVGGLAGKFSKTEFEELSQRLEKDLQKPDEDFVPLTMQERETTLEQETIAGGAGIKGLVKSTAFINPILRTFENSPSLKVRKTLPKLVRNNVFLTKNEEGIRTDASAEIAIKKYDAGLGTAIEGAVNNYKQYAKQKGVGGGKRFFNIGIDKFYDEVSLAMIRGDKSDIPEVEATARLFRKEVFDPLKEEAIEQGLLPRDVKVETATSYLMRKYNTEKIISQEKDFKNLIRKGAKERLIPQLQNEFRKKEEAIISQVGEINTRISELGKKAEFKKEVDSLKKKKTSLEAKFENQKKDSQVLFGKQIDDTKLRDIDSQIAKATDPEELARLQNFRSVIEKGLQDVKSGFAGEEFIDDIVNSVYDNIRGVERKGGASMPYDIAVGARGPAKERVLTFVTDEELRPFLDTDITRIAKSYTRTLATDVEIKRRFGDVNLKTQIREINEEYTELRKKAKSEKELQKLNKQEKEDIKTIETLRDVLRGQYRSSDPDGIFTKGTQAVRTLNYMTKLGGVVFSSIADITRHNTVHGLNRVFGKGLKTLITNVKAVKLSAKDAGLTGQYKENILGQRTAVMADLNNPYNRDSKFSVMMDYFAENFSKLNGLNYWNNYQKGFASMLTQERLITNIRNFDNIKKKERTYMAFLGIDKDNISILQDQIKKHSFDEKGFPIANLEKWGNKDALRLYQNALNMDVERTIVTKGVGDVPLFMNTEIGKTIMQFKSFSLAAHQQVLIAGLQQKDAAAVLGFTSAIAAGMLVYYLKSVVAGREISDDPEVWITEGLDRSGLIPVIMEVNGVMDKVGLGAGSLLTDKPLSRFQSRNLAGTLAGPSFGLVNDAGVILSMISRGEISESDARTIRRNIPLQNITYLRKIFDELEQALITK